jgi:hypothetical protein
MAAQASAPLDLETLQAAASQDADSRKRTWFFQGMGLAALMLLGVYSASGLAHHDGSEDTSGHDSAVAFHPGVSGIKTRGGFRSATRDPVPVAMNGGQGFGGAETDLEQHVFAYDSNGPQFKQRALSKADVVSKLISNSGDRSMSMLATTAMNSGGDPSQLASVFAIMPAGDKKKVEMMSAEVLAKAKSLPGVTGPLDFFDPLGFCTDCSEGRLCFYREVELKHGRVAMLASLGFLVGENFHPLFGGDIDVPSYLAFQQTPLQTFWPAVVAALAIPEVFSVFDFNSPLGGQPWSVRSDREAGDMGFDPLGLKPADPKELKEMQTKELNNGRLAMIGAAGMIAQEFVSGAKIFA